MKITMYLVIAVMALGLVACGGGEVVPNDEAVAAAVEATVAAKNMDEPKPTIAPTSEPTIEPTIEPTVEPSPTVSPKPVSASNSQNEVEQTKENQVAVIEVINNANLRSGPGTDFPVVGTAFAGDIYPYIGSTNNGWVQLDELGEVWIGLSLVEIKSTGNEVTDVNDPEPAPEPTAIPTIASSAIEAEIYEIEDVSFGATKRYSLFTTVPFPISRQEVKQLCADLVEDYKQEKPFNALAIFLSDVQDRNYPMTIGKCEYAPNGEWREAMDVRTGDYSTHDFYYLITDKVDNPEEATEDRPTEKESEICAAWWNRSDELLDQGIDGFESDEIVNRDIGAIYSLSPNIVGDIVIKCTLWSFR